MKYLLLLIVFVVGLTFFFWPGHPPNQYLQKLISGGFPKITNLNLPGKQKPAFNVLPSLMTAEYASDVTEEDKKFVITGIAATDFYLQKWFGKSINQPAGLRVSISKSTNLENAAQVVVEDGKMAILIETGSTVWKEMTQINTYGGENRNRISAHEYVHVYQFQNGCGRPDVQNPIAPKWFLEGEAEWLSHKVMHAADLIPSFGFPQYSVIPLAKQQTGVLKSFEKVQGIDFAMYSVYTMAVDYLMKDRPIKTLDDFCANLADGKGMSMPEAFNAAFGIPLDQFYENFEAYRKTWSSGSSDQEQSTKEQCSGFASVPQCSFVGSPDSQNYKYCKQCFPNK